MYPDNNDGISVIDISDPSSPAYSFVSNPGTEPLSAEDYLRLYYPLPSEMKDPETRQNEEYNLEAIAALEGEKMVTLEMLAEAWPSEYEKLLEKKSLEQLPAPAPPEPKPVTTPITIPSLADLTLGPSVKIALETGDTAQLEDILWMPSKTSQIQSTLRSITTFPDSGIPLLIKIIAERMKSNADATTVDVSGYALSHSQILQTVSSFTSKVTTLNLSYNTSLKIDTVHQIITSHPALKRLVLLGCPSITDSDMHQLLTPSPQLFLSLEALIHPFLLNQTQPQKRNQKPASPILVHPTHARQQHDHIMLTGLLLPSLHRSSANRPLTGVHNKRSHIQRGN
jgi:hypothetical protein